MMKGSARDSSGKSKEKKKSTKTNTHGSKRQVFHGTKKSTKGNLKKSDIIQKNGRFVSKRKSEQSKKRYKDNIPMQAWSQAVKLRNQARLDEGKTSIGPHLLNRQYGEEYDKVKTLQQKILRNA